MRNVMGGVLAAALCALAIGASSGAYAQATTSTTTKVSNFEVISVDGNYLVVRDQAGTRELTVPSDFRFNVDGKSLAVGDLKAGMKGTATITKTTTVRPVVVTEIKKGKVLSQTGALGRHQRQDSGQDPPLQPVRRRHPRHPALHGRQAGAPVQPRTRRPDQRQDRHRRPAGSADPAAGGRDPRSARSPGGRGARAGRRARGFDAGSDSRAHA